MEKLTKLPNPATLPTGIGRGCAFTSDGQYLAVAHNGVPYITIYKRSGDTFIKLSDPIGLPTGNGYGCAFTSDGQYLAVAHDGVPYITIYKRSGDTFIKLSDPVDLPTGMGWDCTFTSDGQYLAVAYERAPHITIYKRSGDTFIKLSDPVDLPTGTGLGCAFTSDGQYLAVVSDFIIYKRDGDTFEKLPKPAILPGGVTWGCAFTSDGQYLAVSSSLTPYIMIYKRNGDTFEMLPNPATLPTGVGFGCAFTPDGQYLAVAHANSPFVTTYRRNGDTFEKLPNPATLPAGIGYGCAFTSDGEYLAVTHLYSPFVTIYKKESLLVTGSITFRGQSSMSLSAVKTAVGKISFRSGSFMSLIGLVLRELEGIYQISSSEIISRNQPVLSEDLANCIEVWINPAVPASEAEELYRSKEPEEIPPNGTRVFTVEYKKKPAVQVTVDIENPGIHLSIADTKIYGASAVITVANNSSSPQSCTLVVTGKPLEVQGRRKIEVRDEVSIRNHGLVKYVFDSPLVQDEESARDIGNKILRLFAVARANMEISWRGDPALELADILEIPEFESRRLGVLRKDRFYITRQEFIADGGLRVNVRGRKLPAQ